MKNTILIIVCTILFSIGFIWLIDHLISKGVYYITGAVEKATLDQDGNILIIEEEIYDESTYITYEYEEATIGLIAIKNSKGKVIVVVNASNSCEKSPNAYYIQRDNKFICQGCPKSFKVNDLEKNIDTECGLMSIKNRTDINGKIIISAKELQSIKDKFINWNGPKE